MFLSLTAVVIGPPTGPGATAGTATAASRAARTKGRMPSASLSFRSFAVVIAVFFFAPTDHSLDIRRRTSNDLKHLRPFGISAEPCMPNVVDIDLNSRVNVYNWREKSVSVVVDLQYGISLAAVVYEGSALIQTKPSPVTVLVVRV